MNSQPTPAQCVEAYHWYMQHEWTAAECQMIFGRDAAHLYNLFQSYEEQARTTQWGVDDLFLTILKDDEKDCLLRRPIAVWQQHNQK